MLWDDESLLAEAARPKRRDDDWESDHLVAQEPMRGDKKILSRPSTDQKKVRTRMQRAAADEREHPVHDDPEREAALRSAMATATGQDAVLIAKALEDAAADRRAGRTASREWAADLTSAHGTSPTIVRTAYAHTSAETDWMDAALPPVDAVAMDHEMQAEAAVFHHAKSAAVKADPEEYFEQAAGQARAVAGKFGQHREAAERTFMDRCATLLRKEADSLPGGSGRQQTGDFANDHYHWGWQDGHDAKVTSPASSDPQYKRGWDDAKAALARAGKTAGAYDDLAGAGIGSGAWLGSPLSQEDSDRLDMLKRLDDEARERASREWAAKAHDASRTALTEGQPAPVTPQPDDKAGEGSGLDQPPLDGRPEANPATDPTVHPVPSGAADTLGMPRNPYSAAMVSQLATASRARHGRLSITADADADYDMGYALALAGTPLPPGASEDSVEGFQDGLDDVGSGDGGMYSMHTMEARRKNASNRSGGSLSSRITPTWGRTAGARHETAASQRVADSTPNRDKPWDEVHDDYKTVGDDGVRKVIDWTDKGTTLMPWVGPSAGPQKTSGATDTSWPDAGSGSNTEGWASQADGGTTVQRQPGFGYDQPTGKNLEATGEEPVVPAVVPHPGVAASYARRHLAELGSGTYVVLDDPDAGPDGMPAFAGPVRDAVHTLRPGRYDVTRSDGTPDVMHVPSTPGTGSFLQSEASMGRVAVSLTSVGIDGQYGVGTDPSGKRVKFRLSDKDKADLQAILHSDLAINFSGVSVTEDEIVKDATKTAGEMRPATEKETQDYLAGYSKIQGAEETEEGLMVPVTKTAGTSAWEKDTYSYAPGRGETWSVLDSNGDTAAEVTDRRDGTWSWKTYSHGQVKDSGTASSREQAQSSAKTGSSKTAGDLSDLPKAMQDKAKESGDGDSDDDPNAKKDDSDLPDFLKDKDKTAKAIYRAGMRALALEEGQKSPTDLSNGSAGQGTTLDAPSQPGGDEDEANPTWTDPTPSVPSGAADVAGTPKPYTAAQREFRSRVQASLGQFVQR